MAYQNKFFKGINKQLLPIGEPAVAPQTTTACAAINGPNEYMSPNLTEISLRYISEKLLLERQLAASRILFTLIFFMKAKEVATLLISWALTLQIASSSGEKTL